MSRDEGILQIIEAICAQDARYHADAYVFVLHALTYTMEKLGRRGHVRGQELLEGIRAYALEQYGRMARAVFAHWGIASTADFGAIVFKLIDANLLGKTEEDSLDDFKNGYDFKKAFEDDFAY
ncbi:MAG: hypothetical protein NC924_03430 [Candidatus Omnitrophica bacterium]|nr:hypothetical protein [Candidatus Omnitrophota bacterium]